MPRILIVEDEPDIALGLRDDLVREGYDAETVRDGTIAIERGSGEKWDLILLDVMLPGADGFEVCRELRRRKIRTPIIDLAWEPGTNVSDRVVDTHILNLRKKVEPTPAEPRFIRGVRGIGYRFDG